MKLHDLLFLAYLIYQGFAVLLVSAQMNTSDEDVIYKALHSALLTDNNLYILQKTLYPPNSPQNTYVEINITFTVQNIAHCNHCDYCNCDWAFDCNSYERCINRDCENQQCFDVVSISSTTINQEYLLYYVRKYFTILRFVDLSFYNLLNTFVRDNVNDATPDSGDTSNKIQIHLLIKYLPTNPSESDFIKALEVLFSWAKYYARTSDMPMSSPKLDSDKSFAEHRYIDNDFKNDQSPDQSLSNTVIYVTLFCFIVFVNITVMLCGLYVIKLASSDQFTNIIYSVVNIKMKKIMFWSIFSVLFLVNILCFSSEIFLVSKLIQFAFMPTIVIITYFNVPMIILFTLIEICVITKISKNFDIKSHIFCISRPFMVRAVHIYAVCNVLWFAHRVANCFIVSMYFIAIAPSETLAVITLCVSTIVIAISTLASVVHICYSSSSNKCRRVCNTLTILFMVFCIIATLVCFTILFADLTQHGLSASHIGSIILSLAIPALLFALSIIVKKHLKSNGNTTNGNLNSDEASEYQPLQGDNTVKL